MDKRNNNEPKYLDLGSEVMVSNKIGYVVGSYVNNNCEMIYNILFKDGTVEFKRDELRITGYVANCKDDIDKRLKYNNMADGYIIGYKECCRDIEKSLRMMIADHRTEDILKDSIDHYIFINGIQSAIEKYHSIINTKRCLNDNNNSLSNNSDKN